MTQFRASKSLAKKGINDERQGLICYLCLNVKILDKAARDKIRNICIEVGGDDYQALYRFLTDGNVNHEYICYTYFIPKAKLFKLKHQFYLRFNESWE